MNPAGMKTIIISHPELVFLSFSSVLESTMQRDGRNSNKILLVESHDSNGMLRRLLETSRCQLLSPASPDPEIVLSAIETYGPDLVLIEPSSGEPKAIDTLVGQLRSECAVPISCLDPAVANCLFDSFANSRSQTANENSEQKAREAQLLKAQNETEQALTQLNETTASLKQAQKFARLGTWSYDVATRTFTWSEELNLLLERPKLIETVEELFVAVPEESRIRLREMLGSPEVIDPEDGHSYSYWHPDGHLMHFQVTGVPIRDETGEIVRVEGVSQDITESTHNKANIQTQLHRQETAAAISSSFVGPDDFDTQVDRALSLLGNHLQISRAYLFQDEPAQRRWVISNAWAAKGFEAQVEKKNSLAYDTFPGGEERVRERMIIDDVQVLPPPLREFVAAQDIKSFICFPLQTDSEFFGFFGLDECTRQRNWRSSEISIMETCAGIITAALKRQKDEAEIQHLHFMSDFALELTGAGYFHVPLDDSGIYFSSANKVKFMGDPPRPGHRYRVIEDWFDHVKAGDPKAAETTWKAFEDAVAGRIPIYDAQYAYRRPADGRIIWVHTRGKVVKDEAGNATDMYGVTREITHRVQAQRNLEEARDASDRANRAKSQFLANMSHEIRTPMNAILGYSQLMHRDPGLTPTMEAHLDIIQTSGEHLLSLINDVLEMSKIEAGRVQLHPDTFDFYHFIADIENMLRMRTEMEGLRFTCHIDQDVPRRICADEGKIRQILINMLSNAVKFTPEGTIKLRVQTAPAPEGRTGIAVEVEDTGVGIAPDELPRVFDHFEQTDSGRRQGEGTGLGMPISRKYARMLDGDITVVSELGQGSTFRLEFLADPPLATTSEPCDSARVGFPVLMPGQQNNRILIVDDQETNRILLASLLQEMGFQVKEAVDGEEAVRAFTDWQPDLIFMDAMMPVLNGFEATQQIKNSDRGNQIPVVMVTASALEEQKEKAEAHGADDFIRKPYKEEEIWRALENHLEVKFQFIQPADRSEGARQNAQMRREFETMPPVLRVKISSAVSLADQESLLQLLDELESYCPQLTESLRADTLEFNYTNIKSLLNLS